MPLICAHLHSAPNVILNHVANGRFFLIFSVIEYFQTDRILSTRLSINLQFISSFIEIAAG